MVQKQKNNYKKEVQELQKKVAELEQQRDTLIKTLEQVQIKSIQFVPITYPTPYEPYKIYPSWWTSDQITLSDNDGVTCFNE